MRRLRPDYIATSVEYLGIRTLARESWFNELYEDITAPASG